MAIFVVFRAMNTNYFSTTMSSRTDDELKAVINSNNDAVVEEARQAAIWELEKRKQQEEEINKNKDELIAEVTKTNKGTGFFMFRKKHSFETTDTNAPLFYSKLAITMFSVFFSTIFGAILLMTNLRAINNDKARTWVLIFGVVYSTLIIYILNLVGANTNLGFVLNLVGALILTELFWNKEIGKEFLYRRKMIWKPLLISILVLIPFILATLYSLG